MVVEAFLVDALIRQEIDSGIRNTESGEMAIRWLQSQTTKSGNKAMELGKECLLYLSLNASMLCSVHDV